MELPPDIAYAHHSEIGWLQAEEAATELGTPSEQSFGLGDIDVKVQTGFEGTSLSPLSLVLSLLGWNQLAVTADIGIFPIDDFTLGIGAEAFYSRPWLAELLFEGLINAAYNGEVVVDITVWDAGVLGRGTLHTPPEMLGLPAGVDPYLLALAGPTRGVFELGWKDTDTDAEFTAGGAETGLRVGGGIGANLVTDKNWLGAVELRYLLGFHFAQKESSP